MVSKIKQGYASLSMRDSHFLFMLFYCVLNVVRE